MKQQYNIFVFFGLLMGMLTLAACTQKPAQVVYSNLPRGYSLPGGFGPPVAGGPTLPDEPNPPHGLALPETMVLPVALQHIQLLATPPAQPYMVMGHLEETLDPAKMGRAPTRHDAEVLLRALAVRAGAVAVLMPAYDTNPVVPGSVRVKGRAIRYIQP